MKKIPWSDAGIDPLMRKTWLEDAYEEFISNPFWELLQREAAEQKRHGALLLSDPRFNGEQLKFYQGELKVWDGISGLVRRLYEAEEQLIELDAIARANNDAEAPVY